MNAFGAMIASHVPALLMMIAGYVLLVIEMYIPGFGIAGISGTALMVGGIILMSPTPLQALVLVMISVALLAVALTVAMRSATRGRLSRSKMVLNDAVNQTASDDEGDLQFFLGKTGVAHTALRPAGIGEFEGVKLNVVSDGDFVEAGQPIEVIRLDGTRMVVRERKKEA